MIVVLDELFKELVSLLSRVMLQQLRKDFLAEGDSRRDNIRVYGIEETADECTNTIIVKLAHNMGVEISEQELSVSHRLGRKMGKPRPIIAKFVRRDTKTKMMRSKKELRGFNGYRNVFLNDDLTTLRSRLVYELKQTHRKAIVTGQCRAATCVIQFTDLTNDIST